MTPLRQRMIDDMTLHGLKPKTIKAYVPCVARFARYFGKSPTLLGTPEIRTYLLYLTHEKHVSASTYNQYLCALKFLYRITLGREWGLDGLARTRRQTKLPVVLSLQEVTRFLQAVTSIRHRAILMTAYAAGLRISEVLGLRVDDIDSQRMVIRIRQAKGSKDRYVMLSPRLLILLRDYWRARRRRKDYQASPWLFPGNVPGHPLLHVLPTGFMRIRHYGILANRHRHEKLALCRRLLDSGPAFEPESPETEQIPENPSSITPTQVCPVCGAGRMIVIEEFPPLPAGQEAHERFAPCRGFDSS